MMEMRVARLEADVTEMKSDINTLKTDVIEMKSDINTLKSDMATVKTDIAVIKSNYVTKGDLHQEIARQTKWILAGIMSTAGFSLAVARWLF